MSQNKTIYQEVVVRLYINPRYGQSIGPKRRNRFVFNGSIELSTIGQKFFVDLVDLNDLKLACKPTMYLEHSSILAAWIREQGGDPSDADRYFAGQLFTLKPKLFLDGFLLFDVDTGDSLTVMRDEHGGVLLSERFPIVACLREKNGRSPDFFGTNFDLELDVPKPPPVIDEGITGLLKGTGPRI